MEMESQKTGDEVFGLPEILRLILEKLIYTDASYAKLATQTKREAIVCIHGTSVKAFSTKLQVH